MEEADDARRYSSHVQQVIVTIYLPVCRKDTSVTFFSTFLSMTSDMVLTLYQCDGF